VVWFFLFFVLYFLYKDWELAFHISLFLTGMYYFNFAVCEYYSALKSNRFNKEWVKISPLSRKAIKIQYAKIQRKIVPLHFGTKM